MRRAVIDPPGGYSDAVLRVARAIATAEGYYVSESIPSRLNNPGDLKASSVLSVGRDAAGHLEFATIADGWRALYRQLQLIIDGRSQNYMLDMTIAQMGRIYAGNAGAWSANVARMLGVPIDTPLRQVLL